MKTFSDSPSYQDTHKLSVYTQLQRSRLYTQNQRSTVHLPQEKDSYYKGYKHIYLPADHHLPTAD